MCRVPLKGLSTRARFILNSGEVTHFGRGTKPLPNLGWMILLQAPVSSHWWEFSHGGLATAELYNTSPSKPLLPILHYWRPGKHAPTSRETLTLRAWTLVAGDPDSARSYLCELESSLQCCLLPHYRVASLPSEMHNSGEASRVPEQGSLRHASAILRLIT